MFFRRERIKKLTFEDYVQKAREDGFKTQAAESGKVRVERSGVACILEASVDGTPRATTKAGVIVQGEIAALTDQGFQKIFLTPDGKRKPALAEDLRAIHEFQEDLREALGLTSLYNESMGTVSNLYLYDRVQGRDFGHANKPWQGPIQKR